MVFQKSLHHCALDESSLSNGRVNIVDVMITHSSSITHIYPKYFDDILVKKSIFHKIFRRRIRSRPTIFLQILWEFMINSKATLKVPTHMKDNSIHGM